MARQFRLELEAALQPVDLSIGFSEWDGTWQGDAHETGETPESLRYIGGLWDPVGQQWLGKSERPSRIITIQRQQTAALASEAQFLCAFGGQRSGKTNVGRSIALRTLVGKPGSIVYYVVPRFSKEGFILPELIETIEPWIVARNGQEHWWELINGSKLYVFSASSKQHEDSFLGGECDLFILEEFREMPSRIFGKAFSRVISRNGRLAIVTSPEAGHMIEDICNGEWEGHVQFEQHHFSVLKNFFIFTDPEKSILEQAKRLYDPQRYQRDVEGLNVAEAGHDYYNFEKTVHVVEQPPGIPCTELLWQSDDLWLRKDPRWRGPGSMMPDPTMGQCRLVGLDFGATIMSAVEAIITIELPSIYDLSPDRLNYEHTNLVVIAEHQKKDTSVLDFVETVLRPRGLTPDRAVLFCDPSGHARDHVVGAGPVDLLRNRYHYKVFHQSEGSLRLPGIIAIRTRLHLRRLLIMKACRELIGSMCRVRSIGKTQKQVSTDPDGHLPDALRYLVVSTFPDRALMVDDTALSVVQKSYRK
jgi:hypothetical protein